MNRPDPLTSPITSTPSQVDRANQNIGAMAQLLEEYSMHMEELWIYNGFRCKVPRTIFYGLTNIASNPSQDEAL